MRIHFNLRAVLPALTIGALMAIPSFASSITLGVTGDARVGADYISFGTFPMGAPYTPAPGAGTFEVTFPVTNIFADNGVVPGQFGSITSLSQAMEPAGTILGTPVKFVTFTGTGSNLELYMTELYDGSLPNSPFILSDTTAGATATFDVAGYILNTNDNSETAYSGLFNATFAGMSVAGLLGNLPVDTAFSGTFSVTPTPEPASLLLMGVGLLGAGIVARKRAVRS